MKLNGQRIEIREFKVVIPILRGDETIYLQATTIDTSEFDKLYPEPIPATITKPGGVTEKDVRNPKYLEALNKRNTAWTNYTVLMSLLKGTEGLEFETVNLQDPNTYGNLWTELESSLNITMAEKNRIINGVYEAFGLNDEKVEEARKSFLSSARSQQGT